MLREDEAGAIPREEEGTTVTCKHESKRIDGVYKPTAISPPEVTIAMAWTCLDCKTSGATPWHEVDHATQSYALVVEECSRPTSS